MNQASKIGIAFGVAVTLAATTAAAASPVSNTSASGGEYSITMSRPVHVGQQMHFRGDGLTERTVSASTGRAEREVESKRLSVTLVGTATVNAVNADGRPTRMSFAVDECVMTRGDRQTTLAPKGSTLVASADLDGTTFTVNGRTLSRQATEALSLVAPLHQGPLVSDQVFGSSLPRAIGESWAVNVEPALAEIEQRTGQHLDVTQVSGASTLAAVERTHGQPCLLIHSQLFADKVVPSMHEFPSDMKVKSASFRAVYQGLYPSNESLPAFGASARFDMDAVLTRAGARQNQPEMHVHRVCMVDIETTPVSAIGAATDEATEHEFDAVAEAEGEFVENEQD